jgi:hypothetical protein
MVPKSEIRRFLRRAREDLIGLAEALRANNPRQIALYLNDAEGSLDEVRALAEEKYGDAFQAAEEELFEEQDGEEEEDLNDEEGEEEEADEDDDE